MNHVNAIRYNGEYQCSHCGKCWDIHEDAPDCKMTLINTVEMKTVDYFGFKLSVPSSVKFIGTNASGKIHGFFHKPQYCDEFWDTDRCPSLVLATVNLHGLDWRWTLRKC